MISVQKQLVIELTWFNTYKWYQGVYCGRHFLNVFATGTLIIFICKSNRKFNIKKAIEFVLFSIKIVICTLAAEHSILTKGLMQNEFPETHSLL